MFDFLYTTVGGIPVFYIVPILFFGPILIFVMKQIGVQNVFSIPAETMARIRRERDEKDRLTSERRKKMGETERVVRDVKKRTPAQWAGQAVLYTFMAVPMAYCSANPEFVINDPDEAQIKLSLSVPGDHKDPCVTLSAEELRKLPPQRRGRKDCGRERWPVYLELGLDGVQVYARSIRPGGLSSDGTSVFYEKFQVPSGTHRLSVRMRTGGEDSKFTYNLDQDVELVPEQVLAIGFRPEESRITLR